jgi:hypothetical protein
MTFDPGSAFDAAREAEMRCNPHKVSVVLHCPEVTARVLVLDTEKVKMILPYACSLAQAATGTYERDHHATAESLREAQSAVEEAVRAAAAGNIKDLWRLRSFSPGNNILLWSHLQTGVTPLSAAAFGGHILAVNFLLSNGARPGDPNRFGWTPIMSAALGGRVDVLRRLIEHGAGAGGVNLDQQDADGCTALWWACCLGHAEAAQLLMDSGARRDVGSDWGVSPLEVAVRAGRSECVRLLQVCGDEAVVRAGLLLTACHGVCVQGKPQASEVDCPAVQVFDRSLINLVVCRSPVFQGFEALRDDPGLLLARCPYSGQTLLSMSTRCFLTDLGADPTARDWQVGLSIDASPKVSS